jgi:hypothetical protein
LTLNDKQNFQEKKHKGKKQARKKERKKEKVTTNVKSW